MATNLSGKNADKIPEAEHLDEIAKQCKLYRLRWQPEYEHFIDIARKSSQAEDFGSEFVRFLSEVSDEYRGKTGAALLRQMGSPELLVKPYDSCLNKMYRLNVAWNKKWPQEREGGVVTPENWSNHFDDLIRCTLVARYLDGVEVLRSKLTAHFSGKSYACEDRWLGRPSGYYACHFYFKRSFEFVNTSGYPATINTKVEIQLTTEMQENIRSMLRSKYETTRDQGDNWKVDQWKYDSKDFAASYIGHTLHFIEGLIVKLRNESFGESNAKS